MATTLQSPVTRESAAPRRGFARVFAWPRLRFTLAVSCGLGIIVGLNNDTLPLELLRASFMGCCVLLAFGVLETRPRQLPKWLPRTALRLAGVVLVIPLSAAFMAALYYERRQGLSGLVGAGLLFSPWIAVAAILRRRDEIVKEQAFAFELERSEYQRRESDARLRQLQAQVEPHFLFNTLANVQALVDAGSPQASPVLNHLIAYLRAAVPRLQTQTATMADEVELARAYLEIMRMRMPDRLQYELQLAPEAARVTCPPMTLLTLVENAVRHGIDPSETGGRIDASVELRGETCVIRVQDTGVGLRAGSRGGSLGTGLHTLRERLKLVYGPSASLTLSEGRPRGACAEVRFQPAPPTSEPP